MKASQTRLGWQLLVVGIVGLAAAGWQGYRLRISEDQAVHEYAEAEQLSQAEQQKEVEQVNARAQEQTEQRFEAAQQWRELGKQETELRRQLAAAAPGSASHSDLTNRIALLQAERKALATKPGSSSNPAATNQSPAKNIEDPTVKALAEARLAAAATHREEVRAATRQRIPFLIGLGVVSAALFLAGCLLLVRNRTN
jgi:hypothetical protein